MDFYEAHIALYLNTVDIIIADSLIKLGEANFRLPPQGGYRT